MVEDLYTKSSEVPFTTTCVSALNALRKDKPQESEQGRLPKNGQWLFPFTPDFALAIYSDDDVTISNEVF